MKEELHLISTQDTNQLVTSIVDRIKADLGNVISRDHNDYNEFANEESKLTLDHSVRGKHVYVIGDVDGKQSIKGLTIKYNDRLMQLFLLLQTAKNHGAKTINVIPNCFPYARQDKPIQGGLKERVGREPSSAQFMVDIFQDLLNVDYCITIDIHNPATLNNSKKTKFVNLYTGWFVQSVLEKIVKEDGKQFKLSPMDVGGDKKISSIAEDLQLDHLTVVKKRDHSKSNSVEKIFVYGDVEGKHILIHDDMLDTGGSLVKLIKKIGEKNPASINIAITHGMFNKQAVEKLTELHEQGMFENIYITDSVCRENYPDFVKIMPVAPIFANTIKNVWMGGSINYNHGVKPIQKEG